MKATSNACLFEELSQIFTWFLFLQKTHQTLERPALTLSSWIRSKSEKIRHQVCFEVLINGNEIKMFGEIRFLSTYFYCVPVQISGHAFIRAD